MLFAFRGVRGLQVFAALVALAFAIGATLMLKSFTDGGPLPLLFVAGIFGLAFLWLFAIAVRAPTSFVAISPERTRIRFAGFVDTVIANEDILGVELSRHSILGGIGVRTNFSGTVTLASTWGQSADLVLRTPIRVWFVPRLVPVRGTRLRVTVRNPHKLVERFGAPKSASPGPTAARKMAAGGRKRR
jgi:hypothetical protein